MKRSILIGIGVLVVLAAGVVYFVYSSLEGLIEAAIESYGSDITQAEVTLDQVELDATTGTGTLRGLTVGNPAGFRTPSAFDLGAIGIALDIGTIADDVVVVREIAVEAPGVTYELSETGNNIDTLRRNVDAYMAAHGLSGAREGEGDGPKLVIEDLYVRGGTVRLSATILEGKTLDAPLPPIHLTDIGKDTGGATPGEVAERIMVALGNGASRAVAGLGVGNTLDSLRQGLGGITGGVTQGVTGAAAGAGEAAKGVGEEVGTGVEKAGEKLKSLFGN